MPNRLDIPDELNSLIEKREADRRNAEESKEVPEEQPGVAEEQRQGDRRKTE